MRAVKLLVACLAVLALSAPAARADFGLFGFEVAFSEADGSSAGQAGTHPYAMTTSFGLNFTEEGEEVFSEGRIKDFLLQAPPGLVADTTALPPCSSIEFLEDADEDNVPDCPVESQVGITAASSDTLDWRSSPVFTLSPPPGVLLRLGWSIGGDATIVLDLGVNPKPPHNGFALSRNTPQTVEVIGVKAQLWGDPTDPRHDALRGPCLEERNEDLPLEDVEGFQFESTGESCPVPRAAKPFLTLPTQCAKPLLTSYRALSWSDLDADGAPDTDSGGHLTPPLAFCGALPAFDPTIAATPTSRAAESPSGLDFELGIADEGLASNAPGARAKSHIRRVEVTLPEGMTANPSLAEGLEVCSEGDLDDETLASAPGQGCPQAAKIGTIEVDSPLTPQTVHGALYQAKPFANLAEDALIAFYIVLRNANLGVLVKQPVKVEADSETGQLRATTDEIPQLPFSSFRLKFREGARSPLITPPSCDTHPVRAELVPWSGGPAAESTSTFRIVSGPNEGPCPPAGSQPFEPGFQAGTTNNAAGSFSPFVMRLTRRDGDQDLVRFDAVLPPGVTAKLAGVPWCPEAAIARARGRDGKDELRDPSCPAASQIGSVQGGAGVGSQLTYVPGKIYLAGPVGGAPISVVGIVPAVAGPFDIGTIVVRQALDLDPVTGEARVVSAASDDLPHILAGIPLRVRDIQVSVDRPSFTLNPTSCAEMATLAGIWGGGSHVFSKADDFPVLRQARFQAAGCASLGFKPRLAIRLRGGVRRGAHPALRAHVRPRPGDANFSRAVVKLPTSAFLDQGHIRTICTRAQFAAGPGHGALCPPGARYGFARAWSPLLDAPATGPVYLRSSDNNLPDLVVALKGPPSAPVEVEVAARIDSVKGGIRSTFARIPDLPVSRFILDMQGGKKGLIVNSRHLCHKPKRNRARSNLRGQNGKLSRTQPVVRATKCTKRRKAERRSPFRR